ncbi:MAG: efflux RND transporter permease subunit [Planctomycetota bacterium]
MNLAAFTIRNNRTSLVIYAALMLMGVSSYFSIGRLEYPEFTIRNAQIITRYSGRTALQVELEVTEPIEQAVRQMPEVKEVKSTSKNGVSIVAVEVADEHFDLDPIWQRLRNKVASVELPDGAGVPDVNDEFGDVFPYVYALTGTEFTERELLDYGEDIRDALLELDGVAKVEFHGAREERVFVEFSSSEIASYGLSPPNLSSQISLQNSTAASGTLLLGPERVNLVTRGEFEDLDELRRTRLAVSGEATSILLTDIAAVSRSYVEPRREIARHNGSRSLCIAVSMVEGGVVTEIGRRIEARLAELLEELPWGLELETVFFQPRYVDASISAFVVNLGQAFTFVGLVMLLFAGLRIAMAVAVLVPSAILMCFTFMPAFGVQLEMMSIAALIIALGLLVDNAVVVSEQILVRLGKGESRRDACINAVRDLSVPLLAASGTTVAAFSPIALAPGGVSEFTFSLFAVVTITLLCSWVLSLSIVPLFCYAFLKPLERDTWIGRRLAQLYDPYERLLRRAIAGRWRFPVVILLLTILAGWGFGAVPTIFFPPNERGQFVIDFELPLGRDIEETEVEVAAFEEWLLAKYPEDVRSVSSWIGNGGPRWYLSLAPESANPNYAFLTVLTTSEAAADVARVVAGIQEHVVDAFPGARISAKALENGPPVGDPIQVRLYGRDMKRLYACRDRIVAEVRQVAGIDDVRDDWGSWVKQVAVDPDPIRSARLGLTTSEIATALNTQYRGLTASTFRDGDKAIPIVVRSQEDYREQPDRIRDLPLYGAEGGFVPVGQIADVRVDFLPGAIVREDTLRVMTVKAKVHGRYASEVLAEIRPRLAALTAASDWPRGYTIEYGGEQEESAEAQGQIGSVMPIALTILALILIAQFNSIRRFAIILMTIPPMLIGITPGLLLTGSSFGFMTMLGMIALLGIIVNNAILLVDGIDQLRRNGAELQEAIVGSARSRLRPILMTTLTTIIGLLPLALTGGGMWSSMANAMMFGLGFSTILTLVLCPVLFSLLFRDQTSA